jgi:hypothetical protein
MVAESGALAIWHLSAVFLGLEDVWIGRMDDALHLGTDDLGGVWGGGSRHKPLSGGMT